MVVMPRHRRPTEAAEDFLEELVLRVNVLHPLVLVNVPYPHVLVWLRVTDLDPLLGR